MPLGIRLRALGFVLAGLVCCSAALRAQVQAGSEVLLNLDGSISSGYSGSMTNEGPDSHGLDFGGTGNLSGSFHSPQFLSFAVVPFFNQSRANSNYQSISDASGVSASANIFGGSQFPGYFNFSKVYNSESTYSVPGLANYATSGDAQTFGVGWSAHLKSLPSLNFGYQQGSSDYSLYGTQQDSFTDFHSIFGSTNYVVDGFHLSGSIRHSDSSSLFPVLSSPEAPEKTNSDTTTYTLSMSRSLPLDGSSWVNYTRNNTGYNDFGVNTSETSDIVTGGVALRPTKRLLTQISFDYDDNLAGSIFQSVTSTGAIAPVSLVEQPSHSWGLLATAQYSVIQGLYVSGSISHRQQLFLGESFDSNAYSGSVSYGHNLFGGQFTTSANVSESSYGANGESMLGLLTTAIYIRRFGAWGVSGSFGYSRNVQTILIAYTSSGYSYSVSANRPIGRLTLTLGAGGSKSLLTQAQSPSNVTQSYTMGLSGRWLGVGAGYSRSSGSGLLTPAGITILPPGVPPTLLPSVWYGGTTYSASVGSTPIRGLTITGTYLNATSNTTGSSLSSNNKTEQAYAYLTYRVRKVYFNAGYSRLLQGFSASGLAPTMISTYYFGVSRWFKAF